jgi:hypothetical protein
MWGINRIQFTELNAPGGSDLRDMSGRTSSVSRARTYRTPAVMKMVAMRKFKRDELMYRVLSQNSPASGKSQSD